MARLFINDVSGRTQIYEILVSTVSIGRATSNDLVLSNPSVSRHHARLSVFADDHTEVTDLDSTNGVLVNGEAVKERRLAHGDRLTLGEFEIDYDATGDLPLDVETASEVAAELDSLVSTEALASPWTTDVAAGAAALSPAHAAQERLRRLERENHLLKFVVKVDNALSAAAAPDDILQRVMELAFQIENVERGFVMLPAENGGFKPAVIRTKDEALKADARSVVLSRQLIERVTTERLPLLIRNLAEDPRFTRSDSLRLSGTRSAMCAPLVDRKQILGILYVDSLTRPLAFSQDQLGVLSVLAREAAIRLDNSRVREELSRQALEEQALERYLSPSVVEWVLANPDQVLLGGENRLVTVLFADIRGFTPLAEKMEPHAVVGLLNEFFSEMTELVFENGGQFVKYLGDGLMAVFGAPRAHADDAARAAKTAIEMKRALRQLNRKWKQDDQALLRMGIGINTGTATAGSIGPSQPREYTVVGDAVNLASRLCANAAGGQILVSESTREGLEDMPARKLEPIRVKGKDAPVVVYEILWDPVK